MKIFFSIIFISITGISLFAQNIEIIGGMNQNSFYDITWDDGYYSYSFSPALGYVASIGIGDIKIKDLILTLILSYDKYGGEFIESDGMLGGGSTTSAKIDKSVISLDIYPLNINIKNKIHIGFGMKMSRLINEKIEGTHSGWQMGRPSWSHDLNDIYDRYSSLICFGLTGRISYNFKLSDTFTISPQYSCYLGVSPEFDKFPATIKSIRNYLCIGIKKKLK